MNIDTKGIVELFWLNVKRNQDFGYKDLQNQSKHLGHLDGGAGVISFIFLYIHL